MQQSFHEHGPRGSGHEQGDKTMTSTINAATLDAEFLAAGVDAIEVLADMESARVTLDKAREVVDSADTAYGDRCKQTPAIWAAIESGRLTPADIAAKTGVTTMTIGRRKAAGGILAAHPRLNARDAVKYANSHNQKECKAIMALTFDEARAIVSPPKSVKSEAEKDSEALARLLTRARKVHESGDSTRIAAMRASLYAIGDALDGVTVDAEEDIAS